MDNYNINTKSCSSTAGDSSVGATTTATTNSTSNRDDYLKHLNKLSHKISKPTAAATVAVLKKPPPSFDPPNSLPAQPQHQPPVYNINKSDFRDVVQKLTGSTAHENRLPAAAAQQLHQPKPASSRLQRIRPPPLAHVANRPPPMLSGPPGGFRPPAGAPPLSPLPPLPAVHAAAESPVSAYMRYLHSSMASGIGGDPAQKPVASSGFPPLAPLVSPRWSNLAPPQQGVMPQPPAPPVMPPVMNNPQFQVPPPPSPPIPFGCLNSPRSPYPLLSPSLLLSPSSGQLGFPQLPLSPTVPPMPSPTWRSF